MIPTLGELIQRLQNEAIKNPAILSHPLLIDCIKINGLFETVQTVSFNKEGELILQLAT